MEVARRRRRLAGALGIVAVLLLLLPVGAILAFWIRAGVILDRVEREFGESDPEHCPVPLQPLFPDPLPDDAGVHFAAASEALKGFGTSVGAIPVGSSTPALEFPPQGVLDSIGERGRPAADEIRKALRCTVISRKFRIIQESGQLPAPVLLGMAELARRQGHDAEALDRLVLLLGMSQAWPGFGTGYVPDRFDYTTIREWSAVLDGHALTAEEAGTLCGLLDRLESSRTTLPDRVREQCRLRRFDALLYTRPDEYGRYPECNVEPGWRQLWTHRLLAYEAVRETEYDLQELTRICGLPGPEQCAAVSALGESLPPNRVRIRLWSAHEALPVEHDEFVIEVLFRKDLQMARIAAGLAWFEAERGRKPESLTDLVPRYLPRLESCPWTGRSILYEKGALLSPETDGRYTRWPVRRR